MSATTDPEAVAGWRIRCDTCHWEYEDEDDEGPPTAKQAKQMATWHECEPDVVIAPASGDKWYEPSAIDDDGAVR